MRLLAGRRRGLEGCKNLLRCGRMQLSTRLERFMNLADHLDHRPYPLPDAPWVMHQAWCDFLFLHWRVDAAVLRQIVPEPLELHLHEGDAWVGVIPFHMTDVRPRGTVNVPGISAFPELNVRTYVKVGDRVGVYFLSLEAHNRLAVETARLTYGLPYFAAQMSWTRDGNRFSYQSRRTDGRGPAAAFRATYEIGGAYHYTQAGTLESWLSERYCLFTVSDGKVSTTDVHHLPWPMRQASVHIEENTMADDRASLVPSGEEKSEKQKSGKEKSGKEKSGKSSSLAACHVFRKEPCPGVHLRCRGSWRIPC